MKTNKVKLYADISKVEEQDDGTLKVWGYASSEAVDSDGETITSAAMKAAIPDYMKFGAVREMHQAKAAGTAIEADVQDDGRTFFGAHVVDPIAVKKVTTGVYKGFSIGGKVTARDEVNKSIINGINLIEVSLVDRPANPEAVFTMYKAEGIEQEEAVEELAALLDSGKVSAADLVKMAKAQAGDEEEPAPAEEPPAEEITKGMYAVSRFADVLDSLSNICASAEWEAQSEQDSSPVPQALRDWLKTGAGILQDMAAEEVNEMIAALQAQVPSDTLPEVLLMADSVTDLEKSGARNSKADAEKIQAMHDTSVRLGADCGTAKAETVTITKAGELDDITKAALQEMVTKAVSALVEEKDTLQKRVTELEAKPEVGRAVLRVVGKGEDVATVDDAATKSAQAEDEIRMADLTPEQRAAEEIKKIHQSGGIPMTPLMKM